jgi:hypothetical protein
VKSAITAYEALAKAVVWEANEQYRQDDGEGGFDVTAVLVSRYASGILKRKKKKVFGRCLR